MATIDKQVRNFLERAEKKQLREMIKQMDGINPDKVDKLSKNKCVVKLQHLSHNQLMKLSK